MNDTNRSLITDHRSPPAPPGRACPPPYGYSPRVFARPADFEAPTLYVIGGLYGNSYALDAIDRMAALEAAPPRRVFNGDFHWFDADPPLFAEVQQRVLAHVALRGNVETEIAADDDHGCGCGYPEPVGDAEVERSNCILAGLREVARAVPGARAQLAPLPMHALAQVGPLRIGIVHGDAWSLAGWRFAHDRLHDPANDGLLRSAFDAGGLDGFACSHTCAPALRSLDGRFVINNGAAGMANLSGCTAGLLTRVSTRPLPVGLERARAYGLYERGVWVDALRIDFDVQRWFARFDSLWPADSAAAVSYRQRIAGRIDFTVEQALGRAAIACAA